MNKKPVQILLVDDRPENLLTLEAALEPLGEHLIRAQSGREALRWLLQRDFAVVLIDINMPGIDGFEIASLLRQRRRSEHTPIIFLTAQADAHALTARGYSLGAVDYILTPIHPEVLQTKVRVFADLHRRTMEAHRQARELKKLNAASLAMSKAAGIESMIQAIADEARKIVGAEQALVSLRVEHELPEAMQAVSLAETGEEERMKTVVRSILDSGLIDVGTTVLLSAGEFDEQVPWSPSSSLAEGRRIRGWLSTPLIGRNERSIGVVQASGKSGFGDFDEEDAEILARFAQIAAVTVEGALFRNVQEASRMKDEFLAMLSHELRNPLNAMLGWTRLLREGDLNADTRNRALSIIERNIKSQAKLIEDLMDLSRISSGRVRLDITEVDLDAVVRGIVDALRPVAAEKGVALSWTESAGTRVSGDTERLGQVVWNLLTNAIKFTPSGGRVDVELLRLGARAEIVVRDTGDGIAADFLPYIFDHYWQGTKRKEGGGLGLGLAIARQMVALHGGDIRAESAGQGRGATFTVRLPILGVEDGSAWTNGVGTADARSALEDAPRLDGVRVLVVDDDLDSREFLRSALQQRGAEAAVATSAKEALALLDQLHADVLVSDIVMPGEDGCALIQMVRARGAMRGGKVPAVAITGSVRGDDERQRVLDAGFQVFMAKPVELTSLIECISQLALSRTARASAEPAAG
jgi:signal transduction histidine kinase/DNA-binding response OmpR family regulator